MTKENPFAFFEKSVFCQILRKKVCNLPKSKGKKSVYTDKNSMSGRSAIMYRSFLLGGKPRVRFSTQLKLFIIYIFIPHTLARWEILDLAVTNSSRFITTFSLDTTVHRKSSWECVTGRPLICGVLAASWGSSPRGIHSLWHVHCYYTITLLCRLDGCWVQHYGSEHTDLFGLTDGTNTFNGCEDFHSGFHTSLCGKYINFTMYGTCKSKRHFRFYVALTNVQVFLFLFLHLLNYAN